MHTKGPLGALFHGAKFDFYNLLRYSLVMH